MTKQIKTYIRQLSKTPGSHVGVITRKVSEHFPEADLNEIRNEAMKVCNAKYSNVKSRIKSSIRYQ
jgi:hypothetical protein